MLKLLYRSIVLGGAETLLLRIARYCKKNNIAVDLYCSMIAHEMDNDFRGACTNIHITQTPYKDIVYSATDQDIVLTLMLDDFAECELYAKKRSFVKVICYVVHKDGLKFNIRYPLVDRIFARAFRNQIGHYLDNGNIIFMEQADLDLTRQYYQLQGEGRKVLVFRLPIETVDVLDEDVQKKADQRAECFKILTIARADFPFKGYVKGLIALIADLSKVNSQIELKIISSGGQVDKIDDWIKEFAGGADVKAAYDVEYRDLAGLYHETHLYIGMGTTVLEASDYAVPSIHIDSYTYDVIGECFFHEFPYIVGCKQGSREIVKSLIKNTLEESNEEYIQQCKAAKKVIDAQFSMEAFVNGLLIYELETNEHYIGNIMQVKKVMIKVRNKLQQILNILKGK